MTGRVTGAVPGLLLGAGLVLLLAHLRARRRPSLDVRVAPYLGAVVVTLPGADLFGAAALGGVARILRPTWQRAGGRLDHVLGGAASLRRRLEAAGGGTTLEQFRLEQLAWGGACFGAALSLLLVLLAGGSPIAAPAAFVLCCCAAVGGVLAREQLLNLRVRRRADEIAAQFPAVAELLALAVAAGEGAPGAVRRVARVCSGELAVELTRVLDDSRTGRGFTDALRALAERVAVPAVSRFVEGLGIAIERGTPLADVLRAQAADAREARRRELMETAGRREIAMLVPVVFLILPVTVLFALFPGYYGLSLSVT